MAAITEYTSREGHPDCTPETVYKFVTDMRNLKNLLPSGSREGTDFTEQSCNFSFAPAGNVSLRITEKQEYSRVSYDGTLFGSQDFTMILNIKENREMKADVFIVLASGMPPVLKMMAEKYVKQFLEVVIGEMEKFRGWK